MFFLYFAGDLGERHLPAELDIRGMQCIGVPPIDIPEEFR
jgi:hypothetical protein